MEKRRELLQMFHKEQQRGKQRMIPRRNVYPVPSVVQSSKTKLCCQFTQATTTRWTPLPVRIARKGSSVTGGPTRTTSRSAVLARPSFSAVRFVRKSSFQKRTVLYTKESRSTKHQRRVLRILQVLSKKAKQ